MKSFCTAFLALAAMLYQIPAFTQLSPDDLVGSFDATVKAIEIDQQRGIAYLGGDFHTYKPSYNGGDIFSRNSYEPLRTLPWIPYVDQVVDDGEGGWFVASGYIEGIDESSAYDYHIVHVYADGTVENTPFMYESMNAGFEVDGMIRYNEYLIVHADLDVNVYNWQTGEEVPFDFTSDGWIYDLKVRNGILYIAGGFDFINNQARSMVCAFDMSTWQLTDWAIDINQQFPSAFEYGWCDGIEFTASNAYFLIGRNYYNGNTSGSVSDVVRFDIETWTYNWFVPIYLESAQDLECTGDRLFVVANDNYNGTSYSDILYWNDVENPGDDFQINSIQIGSINKLIASEEKLFISGVFQEVMNQERRGFAVIDAVAMTLLPEHLPYNGSNGVINHAVPSGDQIFLTTTEGPLGGKRADYFAAINLNTGSLMPFGVTMDEPIVDMTLLPSGDTLFLAGVGLINDDISPTHLLAINPVDQTIISSYFSTPSLTSIDAVGNSLFIQFSGTNVEVNGQGRSRIASFDLNTFELQPVYLNINGQIKSFDLRNDTLLISGDFTGVNNSIRNTLAMLTWGDFSVLEWDPNVLNMEFQDFGYMVGARWARFYENTVLSVGYFSPAVANGNNTGVCRFTLDQGIRLPGNEFPITGNIFQIANCRIRGEKLYIAGGFMNAANSRHLSAFNLSTGTWENQNTYANNSLFVVNDIELYGDKLISGGNFTNFVDNDNYRYCLTWDMGCFPSQVSLPSIVEHCEVANWSINALWQNSEPDIYTWEISNDNGENWSIYSTSGAQINLTDGDYTSSLLRVIGISSCDTTLSNIAQVSVVASQAIQATISSAEICLGSAGVLNAPIDVSWNNGAISGDPFNALMLGLNQAIATAEVGCYAPDTVEWFVNNLPELNFTVLDSLDCINQNATILLSGSGGQTPYTYLYNNNAINAFITNALPFQVYEVRDANYCEASSMIDLSFQSICSGCMDPEANNYNPQAIFELPCDYTTASCNYDLSGDGVINTADIMLLISNFGCEGNCAGDVDNDLVVGVNDLYYIIGNFELPCE